MNPLTLVLTLLLAAPVLAQPAQRPRYDPATADTVRGIVRSFEVQPSQYGTHYGVHLLLDAGTESLTVHMGPSWFLGNQDEQIDVGAEVEVVGSRVEIDGTTALIAREVHRGDAVLVLRDEAGYPVWRGWRRGNRPGRG